MKARKPANRRSDAVAVTSESLSYVVGRPPRHEIVEEAICGLRHDLEEVRKLTLRA